MRGLRLTVYDVLEYLASGMAEDEILSDFPDLEREDIRASLAFAVDRERRTVSVPRVRNCFLTKTFRRDCLPIAWSSAKSSADVAR